MEKIRCGNFIVKLAETETEYKQLYKLRYFDLLLHYNHDLKKDIEEDKDEYDEYCDHLIVIDLENNEVIASYRLIKKNHLNKLHKFLTETEFDISLLKKYELLELGRAVVKEEYRNGGAIIALWKGVIRYIVDEKIEYLIGTASFSGTDYHLYSDTLTYLYDNYLANEDIRCKVNDYSSIKMNLVQEYNEREAKAKISPLIKGYLNLGSKVGDGAFIDVNFNSIDVLMILKVSEINERYVKRFLGV